MAWNKPICQWLSNTFLKYTSLYIRLDNALDIFTQMVNKHFKLNMFEMLTEYMFLKPHILK